MRERRGARIAVLTVLALLVLVWASTATVTRLSGELPTPETSWEPPTQDPDELAEEQWLREPPGETLSPGERSAWWDIVALVVNSVLAVGVLALAGYVVLRLVRWWRGRVTDERLPAEEDELDLDVLLQATGTEARQRAATEGDPRNAVVACWVRLEDAAEQAGLERHPAETSAELVERVLAHWEVDAATIAELAELYRTARFSRQPLTEEHRSRAVTALEAVHAAIVARREAQESGEPRGAGR